jgi:MoaD family protein
LQAATVSDLLLEMEATYPGLSARLRDEEGQLRRALHIYVNGENIRFLGSVNTALTDGDQISIVPSIAGG